MGIYTAPGVLAYVVKGTDTEHRSFRLAPGPTTRRSSNGTAVVVRLQLRSRLKSPAAVSKPSTVWKPSKGWKGYGELPPKYDICSLRVPASPGV